MPARSLSTHSLAILRVFRALQNGECTLDCLYATEPANVCGCSCDGRLHAAAVAIDAYGLSVQTVTGIVTGNN